MNNLANGDVVTLSGSPTGTFADANVGNGKTVSISGLSLTGAGASNYTLTQPTTTANITAKNLTITGAVAQNKPYDGNTNAIITGATLQGVISPDVVNFTGGGTFAQSNAGTNITVTSNLSLGGTDAGNYSLTQPTGLTANITKIAPVITPNSINVSVGNTYPLPGGITSTSNGVISYSISGGGAATYDGVTTITGVFVGTETLTVNQAEGTNHTSGSATVTVNVTEIVYNTGDYRSASSGLWNPSVTQTTAYATWDQKSATGWNLNVSPPPTNTSNKLYIQNGHIVSSGTSYGNLVKIYIQNGGKFIHLHSSTAHTVYIYKGGEFEFGNNALTISTLFEIEDGGNFIYNYTANYGSGINLWNGTEVFHPNSNFIVKAANTGSGGYFLPADNRISQFPGTDGYFGNLIFDQLNADVRLTTTNFNNKKITNGNLELKPPSGGTHNLFYGNINWTIGKDLIVSNNTNNSTNPGNINLTTGSNNITLNVMGNYINNSKNTFRLSNSTSSSPINTLNIDGDIFLNNNSVLNMRFGTVGSAIINLKGNLNVSANAQLQGVNSGAIFNFSGTGDGLTPETTQNINVLNPETASNITFNVNPGAYAKLDAGFTLGANSILNVDGIFDADDKILAGASGTQTLNVNSTGKFRTANANGFSGSSITSVGDGIETITQNTGSTVEYYANTPQIVTNQVFGDTPDHYNYQNLLITGSGDKTAAHGDVIVNGMTSIKSTDAVLRVPRPGNIPNATPIPLDTTPNVFYALGGIDNTNGTTGKFVLSSDANLIQHNDSRNNADNSKASIVVERYVHDMDANNPVTTPVLWDYVYWSSPIKNHALRPFSPGTQTNRFYEYRESNNLFYNAPENVFCDAKGYAIRAEGDLGFTYNKTYEFIGEPNNANSYVSPILKMENNGYNLVGNPYPSNIDLDALFSTNSSNIYSVAYFWTNNTPTYYQSGASYVSNSYAIYNGTGGVPATTNATGGTTDYNVTATPNGYAKVGQGFIVKAKTHNVEGLKFNTNMRAADNDMFFHRQVKNRFWINLSSPSQIVNTILVGYVPGATNEFEQDFDTNLMTVGSDAIYSILGTRKLAIQGKEDNFQVTDVIPIGVKFFELGKYTIDIPTREGLFETQKIYLKDKYRGNSIHDFTNGGYTFKAGPGEFKDRFEIIFKRRNISVSSQASLHTLTDGKINIIKENDFISISSSNSLLKKVEIFNLSGRSIYQNQTINQTQLQIPAGIFGKEILIVNVETSEGEIVSKKLINN
ncbi:hypothetical protein ABID46_002436 [Moheibacter stercoris]|uniref:YDG domain-containing protein n=1 Tax=Moheibacter stercoris TaxID=1628251 RepID=A0ABV2LWB8_9FLAO